MRISTLLNFVRHRLEIANKAVPNKSGEQKLHLFLRLLSSAFFFTSSQLIDEYYFVHLQIITVPLAVPFEVITFVASCFVLVWAISEFGMENAAKMVVAFFITPPPDKRL